jgi:hypothetical protein
MFFVQASLVIFFFFFFFLFLVAMEPKQRAAASASSQAKVKMSKQVARVVGFDLRTSTEIKMSLAASDPRLLQKNRALGWASVLRVKVSRAQDLAQKNTVTGKSDPYVVVSLGAREFQTAYIPKNLNPIWNEVHECVLSKGDMEGMLVFRVYDYDAILTHQFMGEVQFDMAKTKFPFKVDIFFVFFATASPSNMVSFKKKRVGRSCNPAADPTRRSQERFCSAFRFVSLRRRSDFLSAASACLQVLFLARES